MFRFPRFAGGLVALAALTGSAGCAPPAPEAGDWRAVLELPGGELPFQLSLVRDGENWSATLINGAERVRVEDVTVGSGTIVMALPAFNTRIVARTSDDEMQGELTLIKRGGVAQVMPFRATAGDRFRFFPEPASDYAVLSGRWAVQFRDEGGNVTDAVAEFSQQGTTLTGTFLTATGDYRFLAGDVHGRDLKLSTFDGAHAFLFSASVGDDGTLQGDFWSGTAWHESWVARRDDKATLPDAYSMTTLNDTAETLAFSFPDTAGNPVSLADPRFAGKVVLVTMAGSWCPNCHDEAAFLGPFYERYRGAGLEIVGLMYEHLEDFPAAARQVEAFRAKFNLGYPLLIAGSSDKTRAARSLPMLDRVIAYPTTFFIDRAGAIRLIHTGFSGPGTGAHYEKLVATFTRKVEELLQE